MNLTVLSYNLFFNKALNKIDRVLEHAQPDIVCLQELETTEENFQKLKACGFNLADYSNSFIKFGRIWGQATFYNPKTVEFVSSSVLNLPRSYYEVMLLILRGGNDPRTVIKADFRKKGSKTIFSVYNLHLSSYQATNRARVRQLEKMLTDIQHSKQRPVIVCGDFNYPYGRRQFENLLAKHRLEEATKSLLYTEVFRFLKIIPIKFKVDYIIYRKLKHIRTGRLHWRLSDHYPILAEFRL